MSANNQSSGAQAVAAAMSNGVKGVSPDGTWEGVTNGNESLTEDQLLDSILGGMEEGSPETGGPSAATPETEGQFEDFNEIDENNETSTNTLSDESSDSQETGDGASDDDTESDDDTSEEDRMRKALAKMLGLDDELDDEHAETDDEEGEKGQKEETPDEDLSKLSAAARMLYDKAAGKSTSLAKSLADSQEYIKQLEAERAEQAAALDAAIPSFDENAFRTNLKSKLSEDERFADWSDEELDDMIEDRVVAAKSRHESRTSQLRDSLLKSVEKVRNKRQQEEEAIKQTHVRTWEALANLTGDNPIVTSVAFQLHLQDDLPVEKAALQARDKFESAVLDHVKSSTSFGKTFSQGLLEWVRESNSALAKSILSSALRGAFRRAPTSVSTAKPSSRSEDSDEPVERSASKRTRKTTPKKRVNAGKLGAIATASELEAELDRLEDTFTKKFTAEDRRRKVGL